MLRAAVLALLLVAGLAGCFGKGGDEGEETATPSPTPTPPPTSSPTPTAAPAPPAYATPVLRGLGVPAYEPTMAVTPAGGLFYVAGVPGYANPPTYMTGSPGALWVYASHDDGTTWTNLTAVPSGHEYYDPFLTSDPATGRVYRAAYQSAALGGNGCIDLAWSDDEGATWAQQPAACGLPPPLHDHESLATGVPRGPLPTMGYPNLLYLCVNRPHGSECAVSRDGGDVYGPFVNVFPSASPDGYCGGLHARVVTDAEGRVFLPRSYCQVPMVAVSEDDGLTWTRHVISDEVLTPPSVLAEVGETAVPYIDVTDVQLAADSAGTLYAVWQGADRLPHVSASLDHGATWSAPASIAAPGLTMSSSLVAVGAGGPGKVAFAYVGTRAEAGLASDLSEADWTGAPWHLFMAISEDGLASAGGLQVLQMSAEADPVGAGDCGINRCAPCEDEQCAGMFDYIDLDVDLKGRPWVALVDVCHEACRADGVRDRAEATVATLAEGPALTAAGGRLPSLDLD